MDFAKYATTIVWATVVLATSLNAQSMPNRFRQLDRDGNGRVTRAEAGNARWLARLDRNSDGAITADELRGLDTAVSDQDESAEIRAERSSKVVAHRDIRYAETADVAATRLSASGRRSWTSRSWPFSTNSGSTMTTCAIGSAGCCRPRLAAVSRIVPSSASN